MTPYNPNTSANAIHQPQAPNMPTNFAQPMSGTAVLGNALGEAGAAMRQNALFEQQKKKDAFSMMMQQKTFELQQAKAAYEMDPNNPKNRANFMNAQAAFMNARNGMIQNQMQLNALAQEGVDVSGVNQGVPALPPGTAPQQAAPAPVPQAPTPQGVGIRPLPEADGGAPAPKPTVQPPVAAGGTAGPAAAAPAAAAQQQKPMSPAEIAERQSIIHGILKNKDATKAYADRAKRLSVRDTELNKEEAKSFNTEQDKILDRLDGVDETRKQIALARELNKGSGTGGFAPYKDSILSWTGGILPKSAADRVANMLGDAEGLDQHYRRRASELISAEAVVAMIGQGKFPANNFSDADRKFIQNTWAQIKNLEGANELIFQIIESKLGYDEQRGTDFLDWKEKAPKIGRAEWSRERRRLAKENDYDGRWRKEANAIVNKFRKTGTASEVIVKDGRIVTRGAGKKVATPTPTPAPATGGGLKTNEDGSFTTGDGINFRVE